MFKIYAKLINEHMLAHLYEHIVFDYIESKLQDEGFVSALDTNMIPETSFDGLVTLSLEFVDARTQTIVENALQNDREAITKEAIKQCVGQISCEELSLIDFDADKVRDALLRAADQPWFDLSEGHSIDVGHPAKTKRGKVSPLWAPAKNPKLFDRVYVDYIYEGEQGDVVKLYVLDQLVSICQYEFRHKMARAGLVTYWKDTHYRRDKKKVQISQELVFPTPVGKVEKEVWKILMATVESLWESELEVRLAKRAHQYGQDTSRFVTMNFDLYAHLGVMVGAKELAHRVTADMVREVSNSIQMSGRQVSK